MTDLSAQVLTAHATGDHAALVGLYTLAAHSAATEEEAGFFLTQAYVFALELGHAEVQELRRRLIAMGRESGSHDPPSPATPLRGKPEQA